MNIRFYYDPETNLPHIYNHNVDEKEVEEILLNPGEDRLGRDDSRVAIGCRNRVSFVNLGLLAEIVAETRFLDICELFMFEIHNPIVCLSSPHTS
jgi:hypothetical protein